MDRLQQGPDVVVVVGLVSVVVVCVVVVSGVVVALVDAVQHTASLV